MNNFFIQAFGVGYLFHNIGFIYRNSGEWPESQDNSLEFCLLVQTMTSVHKKKHNTK
jgi:hypothetical protein